MRADVPCMAPDGLPGAGPGTVWRGFDKYRILVHRRRQAQMKARKALDGNG
ncbi:MAG TPA: hypothetical protein VLD67_09435 [Vicinamibacterales bacterium]|nr:hypothetical protein [Vicinamibacterales bacterium]